MKIDNFNPAAVAREVALTLKHVQRLLGDCARRCDMAKSDLFGDIPDEVEYRLEAAERDAKE